jgi:hypothetical protein
MLLLAASGQLSGLVRVRCLRALVGAALVGIFERLFSQCWLGFSGKYSKWTTRKNDSDERKTAKQREEPPDTVINEERDKPNVQPTKSATPAPSQSTSTCPAPLRPLKLSSSVAANTLTTAAPLALSCDTGSPRQRANYFGQCDRIAAAKPSTKLCENSRSGHHRSDLTKHPLHASAG